MRLKYEPASKPLNLSVKEGAVTWSGINKQVDFKRVVDFSTVVHVRVVNGQDLFARAEVAEGAAENRVCPRQPVRRLLNNPLAITPITR